MKVAESFVINDSTMSSSILVATQGSNFKDSLVQKIVERFKSHSFIKVIDIKNLNEMKLKEWDVICIMHTWEMWKPPIEIKEFFNKNPSLKNKVVFTSSGDGNYKMKDIDAITGASDITDVDKVANLICNRIDSILYQSILTINDVERQFQINE